MEAELRVMVKPFLLQTLKRLALIGADITRVELSTDDLAQQLDVSQQTASRYLVELDKQGLIRREMGVRKQLIAILPAGMNLLQEEYADYRRLFEEKNAIQLKGVVTTGMGEGEYYTEQEGYLEQFEERLGFTPFPGTLNIKVEDVELNKLRVLRQSGGIVIDGFTRDDRTFGGVRCFKTKINSAEGAVVLPLRSHYSTVIEVVSPHCLRERLDLNDGDEIRLQVFMGGSKKGAR